MIEDNRLIVSLVTLQCRTTSSGLLWYRRWKDRPHPHQASQCAAAGSGIRLCHVEAGGNQAAGKKLG